MVFTFVRDQYSQARFKRIYDANIDGWRYDDFHRCCNKKGWTLTIVKTTDDFTFGGFTTAEWDSSGNQKHDPESFLFSVNEGSKYPITRGDRDAIGCYSYCGAKFGKYTGDLEIASESNKNSDSRCRANQPSFNLPAAKAKGSDKKSSSINGGKKKFKSKEVEVYRVFVRIIIKNVLVK
jgi:hypothetical protein